MFQSMRWLWILLWGGILALPLRAQVPTDVLATVNGETVTVDDFKRSYAGYLMTTGTNDTAANRRRHLSHLIDTYLLAQEARRQGHDATPAFQAFRDRLLKKALGGRFFETAFLDSLPAPTDAEIRRAYLNSRTKVVVRHLFYRSEAEARAAYERLRHGADFLEEARRAYHLPAVDSAAGFLGPIGYLTMDDAFAEAAFALSVDSVSTPVRSRYGYHILRVEERVRPALITEDAYQYRRHGIATQLRLRRIRLEGDRFVRTFMERTNVQVDAEAVRALARALADAEDEVSPEPLTVAEGVEVVPISTQALTEALTPETVLATYTFDGETRAFTAGDYYFWLPELPFEEARNSTGASVGRALRNEVLARAGAAAGLAADSVVTHEVAYHSRLHLAAGMQAELRRPPYTPPDDVFLREAFERLRLGTHHSWTVDFTVIPFGNRERAEAARAHLEADPAAAATYPGFTAYQRAALDDHPEWRPHVLRAPLRRYLVVQSGTKGWAVLRVDAREATTPSFEELRPRLAEALAPLVREAALLRELHAAAVITIDEARFEQMMPGGTAP